MNRHIFLLILFFSLSSYLWAQVPDDEEDVYFILSGEADKAIEEGDYETAVLRIREALSVDPTNPSNVLLLSNLGTVYNYLDKDSLALQTFNDAYRIAPSMTLLLEKRGRLLLKMGDKAGAYQDFGEVISRDSCNTTARYYHGFMALYGGDRSGAERDFTVLEQVAPDDLNTAIAMGTLYSLTGRDREAIPYYTKILEAEPVAEFYAALAGCYLAIDELNEASSTIAEGLEKFPDDPELYYYRAWLNRERYQLKEAHADALRAVDLGLDPRRAEALFAK